MLSVYAINYVIFFLDLNLPQYKYVVHVVIGEQRGQGIKVGARCLWDSDADGHASDSFISVRLLGSSVSKCALSIK